MCVFFMDKWDASPGQQTSGKEKSKTIGVGSFETLLESGKTFFGQITVEFSGNLDEYFKTFFDFISMSNRESICKLFVRSARNLFSDCEMKSGIGQCGFTWSLTVGEEAAAVHPLSSAEHFRVGHYFQSLDRVLAELESRFSGNER